MLLVPEHEQEFAAVGTVAEVAETRPPARRRARRRAPGPAPRRRRRRSHDARRAAVRRGRGASRPRSGRRPHARTSSASTAPWSRRSSSCAATTAGSRRSCAASPSPARSPTRAATRRTSAIEQKVELLQTLDVTERLELALGFQRERLAELAGPQADPRRRRVRRREAAARVLPAQADGVDPQGARRGRRLGRRGVPDEDRRGRDARRRSASRPRRSSDGSSGSASRAPSRA